MLLAFHQHAQMLDWCGSWTCISITAKDPLEPFTAGSFLAVQFNASQKPFVVDLFVCFANDNSEDQ